MSGVQLACLKKQLQAIAPRKRTDKLMHHGGSNPEIARGLANVFAHGASKKEISSIIAAVKLLACAMSFATEHHACGPTRTGLRDKQQGREKTMKIVKLGIIGLGIAVLIACIIMIISGAWAAAIGLVPAAVATAGAISQYRKEHP